MLQKREIMLAVGIVDDPLDPVDPWQLAKESMEHFEQLLVAERVVYVEYLEDEWGEPI